MYVQGEEHSHIKEWFNMSSLVLVLQRTEREATIKAQPQRSQASPNTALAELLYFMLHESASKLWELVIAKQRSFFHPSKASVDSLPSMPRGLLGLSLYLNLCRV